MAENVYAGIGGHYWDKSANATVTRGEYFLRDEDLITFGGPVTIIGTGTTNKIFRKREIKRYNSAAGIDPCLGSSIEWREEISTWTAEDYALKGTHNRKRDLSIMLRGEMSVKNMGSGDIEPGDTVVPIAGGCEKMTTSGQHSLGRSQQRIKSLKYGLVYVNPDYEKAII